MKTILHLLTLLILQFQIFSQNNQLSVYIPMDGQLGNYGEKQVNVTEFGVLPFLSGVSNAYGNQSASFDGSGRFTANASGIGNLNEFTVSFWVKFTKEARSSGTRIIRHKHGNNSGIFSTAFWLDGRFAVSFQNNNGYAVELTHRSVQLNRWYNITWTAKSGESLVLYVDGVRVSEGNLPIGQFLLDGQYEFGSGDEYQFSHGQIDEFRIFNMKLAADRIGELANPALSFDSDMDDAPDIWEASHLLSVYRSDMDNDGLLDGLEVGFERYEIVNGNFTWDEAKLDAEKRGGHLATFTSSAEYTTALNTVLNGQYPALWIGATDEKLEGNWEWITGEPWTFEKWAQGQPDNRDVFGPTHFAHLYGSTHNLASFWNDRADGGVPDWPDTQAARQNPQVNPAISGYLLEVGYPSNPTDSDTDGDGANDKAEFDFGSDPNDPDSFPIQEPEYIVTITPQSLTAIIGSSVEFQATLNVDGSAFFQWFRNGQPLIGANSDSLNFENVSVELSGEITVNAVVGQQSGLSAPVLLSVIDPDTDQDGLKLSIERELGTNPENSDSDGDGLNDGDEVNTYKTNPLKNDSDGDRLLDGEEILVHATNPNASDSDSDGFDDNYEIQWGTDPNNAKEHPIPPTTGRISKITLGIQLEFITANDKEYYLEVSSNLTNWNRDSENFVGTGNWHKFNRDRAAKFKVWRLVPVKKNNN